MFFSNLKIFLKQLLRSKMYSAVTILGFSISLMFVILLSVYIEQELSVDKFHKNKDRIYRLTSEKASNFAPPIGERLKNQYPEIEDFCRLFTQQGNIKSPEQKKFLFEYLLVDPSFFKMFSFNLVEGNPVEVLRAKNSIVLSRSFAVRLFGSQSPVGKEVSINNFHKFIVTGIVEDFPQNTHFQACDALINFTFLPDLWGWPEGLTSDANSSFALYFLAKPNSNLPSKEKSILEQFKKDFWLYKNGYAKDVKMEPLPDIYFGGIEGSGAKGNSKRLIVILSTISLLILVLAIINYINLSVARSSMRSREVAVKKLLGSSRFRLFGQFISESVLVCLLALNVALILAKLAEPVFNNLLNTYINLSEWFNIGNSALYLAGIAVIGGISGLIPAIMITRFNANEIVKGAFRRRSKNVMSKILISFQYTAAIFLIICAWVIYRQTSYMKSYDIGFNKENILWVKNNLSGDRKEAFRSEMKKISGVVEVSFVAGSPIDGGNNQSFNYNNKPVSFQEFKVDSLFFKMFGIKEEQTGVGYTQNAIWLNHTAIKELNLEKQPKTFKFDDQDLPIVGVVNDFHFQDLHQMVGPAIIRQLDKDWPWTIFIQLTSDNPLNTLERIQTVYNTFTDGIPMDYGFVDDTIYKWYQTEERTAKIIGYFSLLAIIISVMGILAMATFYIEQRVKEIGIRKVNGATEVELIRMLNFDLIKWVLVSFIIACPIAFYASARWLENFPYKTTISWWIFALSGFVVVLVALITVTWQSWRAASRNPVEALRYE